MCCPLTELLDRCEDLLQDITFFCDGSRCCYFLFNVLWLVFIVALYIVDQRGRTPLRMHRCGTIPAVIMRMLEKGINGEKHYLVFLEHSQLSCPPVSGYQESRGERTGPV